MGASAPALLIPVVQAKMISVIPAADKGAPRARRSASTNGFPPAADAIPFFGGSVTPGIRSRPPE